MKIFFSATALLLLLNLFPGLSHAQALHVNTMPSWANNHAESNFLFNQEMIIWGTAFGGTPPYMDTIRIDGVWIPNSTLFEDPYPVLNPDAYLYGHFFSRQVIFYSCGFHTIELKVTDAAGNSAVSQSTILIHNDPPFHVKVNTRIERGLLYLYKNCLKFPQASGVCWKGNDAAGGLTTDYSYATTGAAIMAFEENGHFYTNDSATDPFAAMLRKGMRFLFHAAGQNSITNHDDGTGLKISDLFTSPVAGTGGCNTGNGKGSYLYNSTEMHATYVNAFCMMAVALSQRDSLEAGANLIENGCFQGWTYKQFMKDAMDLIFNYQGDFLYRGGWGYPMTNSAYYDGSLQQWPCLVLSALENRHGFVSPDWVKDNVNYLYSFLITPEGACGYAQPFMGNTGKTGGMLASYAWSGKLISGGDPQALAALAYIESVYDAIGGNGGNAGWAGGFYAMYALKKGLALQEITSITFGSPPQARDWYRDMVAWLTAGELCSLPSPGFAGSSQSLDYGFGQRPDGSWSSIDFYGATNLSTTHAILVLTPNIFNIPEPDPTPVFYACQGDSVQISCTPGVSVEWFSFPFGFYSTNPTPTVAPDTTKIYFAYVYDTIGCIKEVDSVKVAVFNTTQPLAAFNSPLCLGDTLQLTSQPGYAHAWSGPGGFTSDLQCPLIPGVSSLHQGWYIINMHDTNNCFTYDSIYVAVNQPPVPVVGSNSPVCTFDTLSLQASAGVVFQWTGPDFYQSGLQNPLLGNAQATMAGTYYVTVTDGNGCWGIDSVQVTVLPAPLFLHSSNTPVCQGDTLILMASGAAAYAWIGPGGLTGSDSVFLLPDIQPNQAGTYLLQVMAANQCTDTAHLQVTVKPSPQIIVLQAIPPTCHGDSNGLLQIAASGGSSFSYLWDCCPGHDSPLLQNLPAGNYGLSVVNNESCSKAVELHLSQPEPFLFQIEIIPDTCLGLAMGSILLNNLQGQNPPYLIHWSTGQDGSLAEHLVSSDYQVYISDQMACDSSLSIHVPFLSDPQVWIVPDSAEICKGDSLELQAFGALHYSWAPAFSLSSPHANTVLAYPLQASTVRLVGSDQYLCTDTAYVFINVKDVPEIDLGPDIWLGLGEQVHLHAPLAFASYLWSTGASTSSVLVSDTGLYWVQISNNICDNRDSLNVYQVTDIWVPNAFTPDDNGINDFFAPVCLGCTSIEMQVYDRWGGVIFESNELNAAWNGTSKGTPCQDGVYVYRIRYHKPSPQHYDGVGVLRGMVLLIR